MVSSDALNRHALDVCVVPITSVHHGRFTLRVVIKAGDGGLSHDSWVKCDQGTTPDKPFVVYPPLGRLSSPTLRRVEDAIRLALEFA